MCAHNNPQINGRCCSACLVCWCSVCLIPLWHVDANCVVLAPFCDRKLGNPTSAEKHHHHHLDRNRKSTHTHSKMDHHVQHPRHTAPTNIGLIPHSCSKAIAAHAVPSPRSFACVTNSCGMPRFHRCQDRRVRWCEIHESPAQNVCDCIPCVPMARSVSAKASLAMNACSCASDGKNFSKS